MIKICHYCKKKYKSCPTRNIKYCSEECQHNTQKKRIIKKCKLCRTKIEIIPSRVKGGKGIFCSKRCYSNWMSIYNRGENHPRYKREKRICLCCNEEFKVKPHRKDKFCSRKCWGKFESENRKGKNNPYWKPKIKVRCTTCKKEFEMYPFNTKRKFCNKKCYFIYLKEVRKISPENRKNILKSLIHTRPNKPEKIMLDLLTKYFPNTFKYNGDFSQKVVINNLVPDFVSCNGKKLLIEVFGDYWHNDKVRKIRWNYTEFGRKAVYSQLGYKTLIVWEKELKNNTEEVVDKVRKFINN